MIKKIIKSLVLVVLFAVVLNAGTISLEQMNKYIANADYPDKKQVQLCEREASILKKNPKECLRAVEMLLESSKNLKNGYRFKFNGMTSDETKSILPRIYEQTDKEFINSFIEQSYNNAGVIYSALSQHETKVKMYKKALEYDPSDVDTNFNLGAAYYLGKGVEVNKIKAYEHWRIAAKQGDEEAQKYLDILCSESPWACK